MIVAITGHRKLSPSDAALVTARVEALIYEVRPAVAPHHLVVAVARRAARVSTHDVHRIVVEFGVAIGAARRAPNEGDGREQAAQSQCLALRSLDALPPRRALVVGATHLRAQAVEVLRVGCAQRGDLGGLRDDGAGEVG